MPLGQLLEHALAVQASALAAIPTHRHRTAPPEQSAHGEHLDRLVRDTATDQGTREKVT
jgi:hypothetical protein